MNAKLDTSLDSGQVADCRSIRPERQCSRCMQVKPLDDKHFVPHPECPFGLTRRCRQCDRDERRERKRAKRLAAGLSFGTRTPEKAAKAICSQCCNITDRRPRVGKCKCGLRWEAEPAVEIQTRKFYDWRAHV